MSMSSNMTVNDPGWTRLVSSLSESLSNLDKATSQIRRTTKRVSTEADIEESRAKVDAIVLKTGQQDIAQIHSILQLVEKYVRLHVSVRLEAAKLVSNARVYLDKFQIACDAFEQRTVSVAKTAATLKANRARRSGGGGGLSSSLSSVQNQTSDEGEELLTMQQQQQGPTQREVFEQQLHEEALRDRSRDVREILDNVTDINEIFQHINQLVGEQGEQLDTIAVNVENAEEKTRKGVENLREAAQRQRRNRCVQVSAFFIVFVFLLVVIAVMTA